MHVVYKNEYFKILRNMNKYEWIWIKVPNDLYYWNV